jgi:hypothetical protein
MSIFIPFSPQVVVETFTRWFDLDLSILSSYETLIITILSNLYFFIFWFFIMYFSLKIFNRIYERLF